MKELLWRLLDRLGLRPGDQRIFALDEELADYVHALAEHEQRPAEEVVGDLLTSGLAQRDLAAELWEHWLSLSPREKQIAALMCLGYTNRQIGMRLSISTETVKTHARNTLKKFELGCRDELRLLLADWDFSAWEW